MKLIDILVQELPKRGGWPEGVEEIWQDYDRMMRPLGWFHDELCDDHRRQHYDAHVKINKKQYEAALAASKTEWDGVWMPPVGCDFEYKASSGIWFKATMKFCGNSLAVVDIDGCEALLSIDTPMRPLKTESDMKREAEINELIDAINLTLTDIYSSRIFMDAIRERRIPGIRID